ncbi:MAG: glycogen synthase GlgA [Nitrospirae bacterium]|nr:glycogen synthase GlgA [Nitrospirota bacterium]
MKLLMAASEAAPYIKTGGLGDVTGALLKEFGKADIEAFLMLPLYRRIREKFPLSDTGHRMRIPVGSRRHEGRIFSHGDSLFFLECEEFFDRSELYGTPAGDYPDNPARFAFFARAVPEACAELGLRPDVIHCNDWQTALVPLYLKTLYDTPFFRETATVMTVHNLGYQGVFDGVLFSLTGLGPEWFTPEGIEFYGKINLLKAGLISADIITTVSETYAEEVMSAEFGFGLDGVLRKRAGDLYGVVNGIDTDEWDPATDPLIPARYDRRDLSGKGVCRKELVGECTLDRGEKNAPLVAMVGRLSAQKGIDIFLEAAEEVVSMGARIVVLGRGDEHFQERLIDLADRQKGSVFVKIGYDEAFAHRVYAGSDILLMPSLYEPCGLSQLIAMRYGTVPVARRTGGLADTIMDYAPLRDTGTGFLFRDYRAECLRECLNRAFCAYTAGPKWKKIRRAAMSRDSSWKASSMKYLDLYRIALGRKRREAE